MNLVILFSGQGLQTEQQLEEIKLLAQQQGYADVLAEELPEIYQPSFSSAQLFQNNLAQPIIFALHYLRWQKIKAHLPDPLLFSGYSLGEASAFCCSAALSFRQGLKFIQTRANLMSQAASEHSGLVAIQGLNPTQLQPLLSDTQTEISIKLSESHFIVGGHQSHLKQLMTQAASIGAQHIKALQVSIASHTSLMQHAAQGFADYCKALQFDAMQIPILSTRHGLKYQQSEQACTILVEQIDHGLDWSTCMHSIEQYQPDVILEIGPGNALAKMITTVIPHAACRAYDDFKNVEGLNTWISRQH